jgi:outer membrane lipoprotein-sorting protein
MNFLIKSNWMKKIRIFILWILLSCALTPAASAFAEQQPSLLNQIQQQARQLQTMEADFKRESRYAAVGNDGADRVQANGKMYWRSHLYLRLEQTSPSWEIIIADGQDVWWVRPERKRADVYPIDQFTSTLRSILDILGGLSKIDETFTTDELLPEESDAEAITIALKPKQPRPDLTRLLLRFDRASKNLSGFKFSNVVGDSTEYQFSDIRVNQPIDENKFKYTPPDGYKINDQR